MDDCIFCKIIRREAPAYIIKENEAVIVFLSLENHPLVVTKAHHANIYSMDAALGGVVITRYGHGLPTRRIRVVEAGHPVPDEQGEAAAREILALASALSEDDLLLVLVSGGGSALLSLPLPGVPMADLKAVTRALLAIRAT